VTGRPLKIAFIGGRGVGGTYSGIETYYEEVGSRLAQRGHAVTAYCRNHFTPKVSLYRGIHVRRLPSLRSKHLETISHSVLCTLDCLFRPFDIIQYHAIGSAPLSLLPRLAGRTTILSVRGLDWQRAKWGNFARRFLKFGEWASARCPTATVVVSRTLQQHYSAVHGRTPYFIPNAVVPCAPRPVNRIARYGLEKDRFILFSGRLSPEKGVDVLLEAMRPFRGRIKLALAGGSSYSDGYIDDLRRSAWDDVLFLGSVDRETMQELYSNCYAYVLPSVMEGLSISLLEALSYGTCIVATDIPENLEVIGSSALCFPPGNVAALRSLLQRILDSPECVHEYRRRAVQHAHAQADWDEVARQTESFYYQLLGHAGHAIEVKAIARGHQ
jgi:glycosyltransferase involved in cell wall biosynthesis